LVIILCSTIPVIIYQLLWIRGFHPLIPTFCDCFFSDLLLSELLPTQFSSLPAVRMLSYNLYRPFPPGYYTVPTSEAIFVCYLFPSQYNQPFTHPP
jgi:hypothetical protein